jgi:hypothetical protein
MSSSNIPGGFLREDEPNKPNELSRKERRKLAKQKKKKDRKKKKLQEKLRLENEKAQLLAHTKTSIPAEKDQEESSFSKAEHAKSEHILPNHKTVEEMKNLETDWDPKVMQDVFPEESLFPEIPTLVSQLAEVGNESFVDHNPKGGAMENGENMEQTPKKLNSKPVFFGIDMREFEEAPKDNCLEGGPKISKDQEHEKTGMSENDIAKLSIETTIETPKNEKTSTLFEDPEEEKIGGNFSAITNTNQV